MTIPLSSPDITSLERAAVLRVLAGPTLSLGPCVGEFEAALASFTGTRYAVAVNSGTSALHLCVKAAGLGPGDEVITSPFSFVASSNCILFERAVPVFVDIDPVTLNLDPARIEAAITPRTRAILPVHVFGRPCDMTAIVDIAKRHNLVIIEDSCEALGSSIDGRAAGAWGAMGTFAFYPNKQITTGEGGAVVTDDPALAALCRSWRNQGRGESGAWLQHERMGYNYRLSDINCALGTAQMARLPEIVEKRSRVAENYGRALRHLDELILPPPAPPGVTISWFVYVVTLRPEFSRDHRDQILSDLRASGIGCNNYFSPIHLQSYFVDSFGYRPGDFPLTESVSARTIALPFFNALSASEIDTVASVLSASLERLRFAGVTRRAVALAK